MTSNRMAEARQLKNRFLKNLPYVFILFLFFGIQRPALAVVEYVPPGPSYVEAAIGYVQILDLYPACKVSGIDFDNAANSHFYNPPADHTLVKPIDATNVTRTDGGVEIVEVNPLFACPTTIVNSPTFPIKEGKDPGAFDKLLIGLFSFLFTQIGNIGLWLLEIASQLMGYFIGVGSYVSHPFVANGWPFIQGIANLGFILALIFIAIATLLQLDSYGIKKMLPKLLIAALLINFSLIIAGALIDVSRLIMGILVLAGAPAGAANVNQGLMDIGNNLVHQSPLLNALTVNNRLVEQGNYSWSLPFLSLRAALLIWTILIGVGFVTVLLFVRYIILLILLIFSPLAYLASALPNAGGLAKKWWQEFLTWVFYGPIIVFFLVLISKLAGAFKPQNNVGFGANVEASFFEIAIMAGLLILCAKFGRQLAGSGGGAAIDFTKSLPGKAYRNPKKTAAVIAGLATGGVGAGALGVLTAAGGAALGVKGAGAMAGAARERLARNPISDFLGERRRITDRARQGREAERQRTSSGTLAAQSIYNPAQAARTRQSMGRVSAVQQAGNAAAWYDPALEAQNLRDRNVRNAVSGQQITTIVREAQTGRGNDQQIEILVNSPDMVGRMDEATVNNLMEELRQRVTDPNSTQTTIQQANRMIGDLNRSIRTVNDQQNRPPQPPGNARP